MSKLFLIFVWISLVEFMLPSKYRLSKVKVVLQSISAGVQSNSSFINVLDWWKNINVKLFSQSISFGFIYHETKHPICTRVIGSCNSVDWNCTFLSVFPIVSAEISLLYCWWPAIKCLRTVCNGCAKYAYQWSCVLVYFFWLAKWVFVQFLMSCLAK